MKFPTSKNLIRSELQRERAFLTDALVSGSRDFDAIRESLSRYIELATVYDMLLDKEEKDELK